VGVFELVGEDLQPLQRCLVPGERPRGAELALDDRAVAFGQVTQDVAFLVPLMPTSA
jgi:hypothetical protein